MPGRELTYKEAAEIFYLGTEQEFRDEVSRLRIPENSTGNFWEETLEKYFSKREDEVFDSKIIALSNQKGGEGKTTISLFLSEALSQSGPVLLVDWDPQANVTHLFFKEVRQSVFDTLGYRGEEKVPVEDVVRKVKDDFSILPSSITLANFTTPYERDDFELLKDALLPVRSLYKYIILDCPPSLGLILENALIAADFVLIPIQTRAFSVQGLKDLHGTINKIQKKANPRLKLLGAVLNQFEDARALSGLSNNIKSYFPVFETVIYRRESIPQAQAKRKLLRDYDSKCMGMFDSLAEEMIRRMHGEEK